MEDLVGKKLGNWFVVERGDDRITYPPGRGRAKRTPQYLCRCSCLACELGEPTERLVTGERLRSGRSTSCGRAMPERPCSVAGCSDVAYSRGYCSRHWNSWRTYGDPLRAKTHKYGKRRVDHTYKAWSDMIARCTNPGHPSWTRYGGACPPVVVCGRWTGDGEKHLGGFQAFLDDMGELPSRAHQLHRVEDSLEYGPTTTVWVHKTRHREIHSGRHAP